MTGRPLRFGVQADLDDAARLPAWLRAVEKAGFDLACWSDHIDEPVDPVAALGAAAASTSRLGLMSLLFADGVRHPLVVARIARTVGALSGGRFELGIGAGWRPDDYERIGLPFEDAASRVRRLEQTAVALRAMLGRDGPRLVMGGGGASVLGVAARHADVAFINPTLRPGTTQADRVREMSLANVAAKAGLVRRQAEQAGRDPDAIEIGMLVAVAPDRAAAAARTGASADEVAACASLVYTEDGGACSWVREVSGESGATTFVFQETDLAVLRGLAQDVVGPTRQTAAAQGGGG